MVARRAHNPKVVGSSPASATKEREAEMLPFRHLGDIAERSPAAQRDSLSGSLPEVDPVDHLGTGNQAKIGRD